MGGWEGVVAVVVKSGKCLVGIFPGCTEEERGRGREGKRGFGACWILFLIFIFFVSKGLMVRRSGDDAFEWS